MTNWLDLLLLVVVFFFPTDHSNLFLHSWFILEVFCPRASGRYFGAKFEIFALYSKCGASAGNSAVVIHPVYMLSKQSGGLNCLRMGITATFPLLVQSSNSDEALRIHNLHQMHGTVSLVPNFQFSKQRSLLLLQIHCRPGGLSSMETSRIALYSSIG